MPKVQKLSNKREKVIFIDKRERIVYKSLKDIFPEEIIEHQRKLNISYIRIEENLCTLEDIEKYLKKEIK